MDESKIPLGTDEMRSDPTPLDAEAPKAPSPFPRAVASAPETDGEETTDELTAGKVADAQHSERLARDWIERAAGAAHRAIDGLAGKATAAVDSVGGGASKAVSAPNEWLEAAREAVRERPVVAVGIAALIGAALVASSSGRRR